MATEKELLQGGGWTQDFQVRRRYLGATQWQLSTIVTVRALRMIDIWLEGSLVEDFQVRQHIGSREYGVKASMMILRAVDTVRSYELISKNGMQINLSCDK